MPVPDNSDSVSNTTHSVVAVRYCDKMTKIFESILEYYNLPQPAKDKNQLKLIV